MTLRSTRGTSLPLREPSLTVPGRSYTSMRKLVYWAAERVLGVLLIAGDLSFYLVPPREGRYLAKKHRRLMMNVDGGGVFLAMRLGLPSLAKAWEGSRSIASRCGPHPRA